MVEIYVPVKMDDFNRWVHDLSQIKLVMNAVSTTVDKRCDCPGIQTVNDVMKSKVEQFRKLIVEMRLSIGQVPDNEDPSKL